MKKILLLTMMVVLSATAALAHDFMVDGIYYKINNDSSTVSVTYKGSSASNSKVYSGNVVIPREVTYNDKIYSVTKIGGSAFLDCAALTGVELPNTVTSIAQEAFMRCEALNYVNIPDSVTSIGMYAFGRCLSLTEIHIPSLVTNIGLMAFSWCTGLQHIVVDENNSTYDSRDNCNAIIKTSNNEMIAASVNTVIPNSVERLGRDLFNGFSWMTQINLPNSLVYIGEYAFCNCSGLTSIDIPNTVTEIASCAFDGCSGLTDIVIPPSVKTIAAHAFRDCIGLTSINIPASVTSIGGNIITHCNNITCITVDPANRVYDSRNNCNAIIETSSGKLKVGCNNSTIPENVYWIDMMAFIGCNKMTHIELPSTLTYIAADAFNGCSGLTEIYIPASVGGISLEAFRNCTGLKKIWLNEGLRFLEDFVFFNCSGVESITLPSTLTSIGDYCFDDCASLKDISCLATTPPTMGSYWSFMPSAYNTATLHVPEESLDAYKTAYYWKYFINIEAISTVVPGDINGDGNISISDVTGLIDLLLSGGEMPPYADANGDGVVTIKDVTDLIDMLLNGN